MSLDSGQIDNLRLKLKSVMKQKLQNEKVENSLRNDEYNLNNEIAMIKLESDSLLNRIEEAKNQICQIKYQISMIDICNASENAKIETYTQNILNSHTKGFDIMFDKERELSEKHNKELRDKEAEERELQRQEQEKIKEIDEQKGKEAATVEEECNALERECSILVKKNKAIMLQLRRKLIVAEETRRELMKRKGIELPSENNK